MELTETKIANGTVVAISGRLDGISSVEAQKKLITILQGEGMNLIINFQNVDYITSAGMRTLLLVAKRAKELSKFVCLINLTPQIEEILELTGFLSFLRVYKDLETALHQLQPCKT